nr:MAG TPA: hypothetical protein [Caudoviricetes sp.]
MSLAINVFSISEQNSFRLFSEQFHLLLYPFGKSVSNLSI